jgi:hypothetical protein
MQQPLHWMQQHGQHMHACALPLWLAYTLQCM